MATAEAESTLKVNLALSEEEARFIKAIVQNPTRDDEPLDERAMRQSIFNALSSTV